MGFDAESMDERKYLSVDYDDFTFHIRPSMSEDANTIAVFVENDQQKAAAKLAINRFLSAMAWKDGQAYMLLGGVGFGASRSAKNGKPPLDNYRAKRRLPGRVISRFDFEHLQNPSDPKQKLALALYRDGLCSNSDFYTFLSFYKVINIGKDKGPVQVAWINANLRELRDPASKRVAELQTQFRDIGQYLYKQGRNAIAHAFATPIHDPDDPAALESVALDLPVIRQLAIRFIEQELGVPSMNKIFREHLFELEGFKNLFGAPLTARLARGESIPLHEFPLIPRLTMRLRDRTDISLFHDLPFRIYASENGIVYLGTDIQAQPIYVILALDFTKEELTLDLENFGFIEDRKSASEIAFSNSSLSTFVMANSKSSTERSDYPTNSRSSQRISTWFEHWITGRGILRLWAAGH
jgi:hypothetical protein